MAPKAVSEASVQIWKGRDQFGSLKAGALDSFVFKISKEIWHCSSQQNSTSFVNSLKRGVARFVKF